VKGKVQKGLVRVYLAYKQALSNIKGSPTMEYVIIIAVGAAFATMLYNIFSGDDNKIANAIRKGIEDLVNNKLNDTMGGSSGNPGGNH
jgi:hypothetical protein